MQRDAAFAPFLSLGVIAPPRHPAVQGHTRPNQKEQTLPPAFNPHKDPKDTTQHTMKPAPQEKKKKKKKKKKGLRRQPGSPSPICHGKGERGDGP